MTAHLRMVPKAPVPPAAVQQQVTLVPEAIKLFGRTRWVLYPYRLVGMAVILPHGAGLDCRGTGPFKKHPASFRMRLAWRVIAVPIRNQQVRWQCWKLTLGLWKARLRNH